MVDFFWKEMTKQPAGVLLLKNLYGIKMLLYESLSMAKTTGITKSLCC